LLGRSLDWPAQISRPVVGNRNGHNRSFEGGHPGAGIGGLGTTKSELALLAVAILMCLRGGLAATLPLSFDEAYYWLWSKHLAAGYFEHPALIAAVIRAGTFLFGDTQFGVRLLPLVLSLVASWAVWRSAAVILRDDTAAAIAVLLFNCTLMVAAESFAATPDSLLIAAAALVVWAIAELERTQNGRWWIAVGGALGAAIAAKYTGFFLCLCVAMWLMGRAFASVRVGTNWLRTPWPYAASAIALTMFAPTLYWNATHAFISFRFQFGRVANGHLGLLYLLEFLGGQMALASPGVPALAGVAFCSGVRSPHGSRLPPFLLLMVSLPLAYFALHSLHDRVQANWPCFVYPGLAILAAAAFAENSPAAQPTGAIRLVRMLAIPIVCLILGVAYMQAWFGIIPIGRSDPIARMVGVGVPSVAEAIAAEAYDTGARAIVTTNYPVTSWLRFYGRSRLPVIQIGDDVRFLSSPCAARDLLGGDLLYVTDHAEKELPVAQKHFSRTIWLGKVARSRNGTVIDKFDTFKIGSFHGAAVGRTP